MKTDFRTRHDRLAYAKFVEVMRRVRRDPSMIADARTFVIRHMLPDPHHAAYGRRWLEVLMLSPEDIEREVLADTPTGDLLRDTAPPFGRGLTSRDVANTIDRL